jgi:hypothetical protein
MKRSITIRIPLVSTLAAAALSAGCGSRQQQGWQTCVDRAQGTVVEQRYCDDEAPRYSSRGYVPHYGWYYYPRSYYWDAPGIGARVPTGGSFSSAPLSSTPMARTGVVRGGLGSTASGHSSSSHSSSSSAGS